MNKYFHLLLSLALLLFWSCNQNLEDIAEIIVSEASADVFANGLELESSGNTVAVSFSATQPWTIEIDVTKADNWITVDPARGEAGDVTVIVSTEPNTSVSERIARVSIQCGAVSKAFNVTQAGYIPPEAMIESLTLSESSLTLEEGQEITLTATVLPASIADLVFLQWSSSNPEVAIVDDGKVTGISAGDAFITAKAGAHDATCTVSVVHSPLRCPDEHHPHLIDMGLGVKWACCNLGASVPEESGDHYAWGETEIKAEYTWVTYKWSIDSYTSLVKYNILSDYGLVDNKTSLDAEDDVAHVKLGGNWRLPTGEEVYDFIHTRENEKYQWRWESINDHNGWLITYLENGNSIFLPAAGYRNSTDLSLQDSWGIYWSSSLFLSQPHRAWNIFFDSEKVYDNRVEFRCIGFSIRPVAN